MIDVLMGLIECFVVIVWRLSKKKNDLSKSEGCRVY